MNIELIKILMLISCTSSIISTSIIQKIKSLKVIKCSTCFIYISFIVSIITGIIFTLSFTNYSIIEALWVGLFSFIEADSLYKIFKNKLFSSFSNITNKK